MKGVDEESPGSWSPLAKKLGDFQELCEANRKGAGKGSGRTERKKLVPPPPYNRAIYTITSSVDVLIQ